MSRWADDVLPGSVGAVMVQKAQAAPHVTDMDLYNMAHGGTAVVCELAAQLYVERAERGRLAYRLNLLGEPLGLGPGDVLMRCADGHLWIRNIDANKTACHVCHREGKS